MGVDPENLYKFQNKNNPHINDLLAAVMKNSESMPKEGERKKGKNKKIMLLEDLPDFRSIYVHSPVKVFPLHHAKEGELASSIKAYGNISIVVTTNGTVYTWGGGGNTPSEETGLLGRELGMKGDKGIIKNITHVPTAVPLGDIYVTNIKVLDNGRRIVASELSKSQRVGDMIGGDSEEENS